MQEYMILSDNDEAILISKSSMLILLIYVVYNVKKKGIIVSLQLLTDDILLQSKAEVSRENHLWAETLNIE